MTGDKPLQASLKRSIVATQNLNKRLAAALRVEYEPRDFLGREWPTFGASNLWAAHIKPAFFPRRHSPSSWTGAINRAFRAVDGAPCPAPGSARREHNARCLENLRRVADVRAGLGRPGRAMFEAG